MFFLTLKSGAPPTRTLADMQQSCNKNFPDPAKSSMVVLKNKKVQNHQKALGFSLHTQ